MLPQPQLKTTTPLHRKQTSDQPKNSKHRQPLHPSTKNPSSPKFFSKKSRRTKVRANPWGRHSAAARREVPRAPHSLALLSFFNRPVSLAPAKPPCPPCPRGPLAPCNRFASPLSLCPLRAPANSRCALSATRPCPFSHSPPPPLPPPPGIADSFFVFFRFTSCLCVCARVCGFSFLRIAARHTRAVRTSFRMAVCACVCVCVLYM